MVCDTNFRTDSHSQTAEKPEKGCPGEVVLAENSIRNRKLHTKKLAILQALAHSTLKPNVPICE